MNFKRLDYTGLAACSRMLPYILQAPSVDHLKGSQRNSLASAGLREYVYQNQARDEYSVLVCFSNLKRLPGHRCKTPTLYISCWRWILISHTAYNIFYVYTSIRV